MSCQPKLARTPHDLHGRGPDLVVSGEAVAVVEELVVAFGPVLCERGGDPVHGRAPHLHVGVAPLAGVAGITAPLLGDAHAAGEGGVLVDDKGLAVAAVVLLERRQPQRFAEPGHLDAGVLHGIEQVLLDLLGAEPVEQQPYPHPRPGTVGERGGEVAGDLTTPVHEGHHVDGALGGAHRVEHRREDRITVAQGYERVAFGGRNADQALQPPAQPLFTGPHVGLPRPAGVLGGFCVLRVLRVLQDAHTAPSDNGGWASCLAHPLNETTSRVSTSALRRGRWSGRRQACAHRTRVPADGAEAVRQRSVKFT
ncbi:hypothetical protein STENM327S_03995 [Streptomyces tendae]